MDPKKLTFWQYVTYRAALYMANPLSLRSLQKDIAAEVNVTHWTSLIIGIVVLMYVVANLFPSLTSATSAYKNASPTFGNLIYILLPILIGAGLLIYFATGLLKTD